MPGALALSGGTDITVMLRRKPVDDVTLVNLKKIPGLDGIHEMKDGGLRLGALVTVSYLGQVLTSPKHAALRIACNSLGTPAVRNLATLGGNIGRASPASDVIPALMPSSSLKVPGEAGGFPWDSCSRGRGVWTAAPVNSSPPWSCRRVRAGWDHTGKPDASGGRTVLWLGSAFRSAGMEALSRNLGWP